MSARTLFVAILAILGAAYWPLATPAVYSQSCNAAPDAPGSFTIERANDNEVLLTWSEPTTGCAPTRYYIDASQDATDSVAADTDDHVLTMPIANTAGNWRFALRAFNANGLSEVRVGSLNDGATSAPPNTCPADTLLPPTLVAANAVGRTLTVQWTPDARCGAAVTGFTIVGQSQPGGPAIGTVTVPYPNVRSWSGSVPPGTYYVSVVTNYYGTSSAASNAIVVHVP